MVNYQEFRIVVEDTANVRFIPPEWTDGVGMREKIVTSRMVDKIITVFDQLLENPYIADNKPFYINRELLEIFGATLFNRLFSDNMRAQFQNVYAKLLDADTRLRVILEFGSAAHPLARLPWEFLYLPDREEGGAGFFLAGGDSRIVLARQVSLNIANLQPAPRPLKLLIVASQPKNLGNLKADEEIEAIRVPLSNLGDQIQIETLLQPTKTDLADKLRDFQPHILHFIGHGQTRNNRGELALISPEFKERDASAAWISDRDFGDMLREFPPRLVFLNACKGAANESSSVFRGVALTLVDVRVSAVVAMRYTIDNDHAQRFAVAFYTALSAGEPIDVAAQMGREALGRVVDGDNFANRNFGSPVVFMQSNIPLVLPQGSELPAQPVMGGGTAAAVRREPCPICDTPNRHTAKTCIKCGTPLDVCRNPDCPREGKFIVRGGYCEECGYPRVSVAESAAGAARAGV